MTRAHKKLDELATFLEQHGDDPQRLDVVRRAQAFKRCWIELAEALVRVRTTGDHRTWGYDDFHRYCQQELHLKAATVDKLTVSYATLKTHAPDVLQRDGVVRAIPSYEAIDYFTRTMGEAANDRPQREVLQLPAREAYDELRTAVFDEARPVTELRKRFDPVFRPVSEIDQELQQVDHALRLTRKLMDALPQVTGLSDQRRTRTAASLDLLREDLDALRGPLVDAASPAKAGAA